MSSFKKNSGMAIIELMFAIFIMTIIGIAGTQFIMNEQRQNIYKSETENMSLTFERIYNEISNNITSDLSLNSDGELVVKHPEEQCTNQIHNRYKVTNNILYCNNKEILNNIKSLNFKIGHDTNSDGIIDEYTNQISNPQGSKFNLMIEAYVISNRVVFGESEYNFINLKNERDYIETDKIISHHRRMVFVK